MKISSYLPESKAWIIIPIALFTIFIPVILTSGNPAPQAADRIPKQDEWVDYGTIFEAGDPGEWDYYLWGGFANSVVKKDGKFFLYYQGASDYRTEYDETVLWRAIGVATSTDGIHFTKYASNPVLTWFPNNNGEEGATSSGVTLGEQGEILLYYGANTEVSSTLVNADGRLAASTDGLSFQDLGMVLDHANPLVWGGGDELFPVGAIYDGSRWIVYYIPNGTLQRGRLGVAVGDQKDRLNESYPVRSGGAAVTVWGTAGHAKIDDRTYALLLNNIRKNLTEVRVFSSVSPNDLSDPVATYTLGNAVQATFLLDEEKKTWFMYYRDENRYGVKLAPDGDMDGTPPSAPGRLSAACIDDSQVKLTWLPAEDNETGIVQYMVYRDGELLGTVKDTSFQDTGLSAEKSYSYQIKAVNFHGVQGPLSTLLKITLLHGGSGCAKDD